MVSAQVVQEVFQATSQVQQGGLMVQVVEEVVVRSTAQQAGQEGQVQGDW
jgi:hypothetical protein